MTAKLWAANVDEIDDLIYWLQDHPDELNPSSRDALARWLFEFRRGANGFPCSATVPETELVAVGVLVEDWVEVLTAHDEEFLTELRALDEGSIRPA
jgi:hypothetical protein